MEPALIAEPKPVLYKDRAKRAQWSVMRTLNVAYSERSLSYCKDIYFPDTVKTKQEKTLHIFSCSSQASHTQQPHVRQVTLLA